VNPPEVTEEAVEVVAPLFDGRIREVDPTMGGEDFARYLEQVPGAFLFLGTRNEAEGLTASIHNPRFQVDEEVLPLGAATLAELALHFGRPDRG
jgi:metal-dependent amidase/aminoacylase/carboxypeptidase family protein